MSAQARLRLESPNSSPSSPRAARRLEQEYRIGIENSKSCLFSSLLLVSTVSSRAFSEDRRKEALVLLREITDRIRRLRRMLE